jgi:hypothetical protein
MEDPAVSEILVSPDPLGLITYMSHTLPPARRKAILLPSGDHAGW